MHLTPELTRDLSPVNLNASLTVVHNSSRKLLKLMLGVYMYTRIKKIKFSMRAYR